MNTMEHIGNRYIARISDHGAATKGMHALTPGQGTLAQTATNNVDRLNGFLKTQNTAMTSADLARDYTLLSIMCGDFRAPRVVGAERFTRHMLRWAQQDEIRHAIFSYDRRRDLDHLRSILHLLVRRSVHEQQDIRQSIVDPLLDDLAQLKRTALIAEGPIHLMTAWQHFVQRWDSEGLSKAMEAALHITSENATAGVNDIAEQYRGVHRQFASIHDSLDDDSEYRQLMRIKQFHDDHVAGMTGCIRRLRDIVGDSPVYPDIEGVRAVMRRMDAEVSAWYRSYAQLMRAFYRQQFGDAMAGFEKQTLKNMYKDIQAGHAERLIATDVALNEIADEITFLNKRVQAWAYELEYLRHRHKDHARIVGIVSRLSHKVRAWWVEQQAQLNRMQRPLAEARDLAQEMERVEALGDDEELVDELRECLQEELAEISPLLAARIEHLMGLRENFVKRRGDGPVPHEIQSMFHTIAVKQEGMYPPWVDNDALLDISINLCLNAINHLPAGEDYGAEIVFGTEGVVIVDNGPGISLERFAELEHNAPVSSTKGTGLGFFLIGKVLLNELTTNAPEKMPAASMRVSTSPGVGTAVSIAFRGDHGFVPRYASARWGSVFRALTHSFTLS